jgi:nicotinamide riboside kinase
MTTIVVTGPESTGKTLISEYLARELNGYWIPEFAREYITEINRPYTYHDLEIIAETQIIQRNKAETKHKGYIILDTWLIITKIWFIEVYGTYPGWLDVAIRDQPVDLYLLCEPDIPWIPDPVRENGGERRKYLFDRYLYEIRQTKVPYEFVSGINEERFINALNKVKQHFID